jgi:hypothetical protein
MQIFKIIIEKTPFTFIRVPYGRGDLWYHISFPRDDRRATFRMCEDVNNKWKIFDTTENWITDLELQFNNAINDFESTLLVEQEGIAQEIAAAS